MDMDWKNKLLNHELRPYLDLEGNFDFDQWNHPYDFEYVGDLAQPDGFITHYPGMYRQHRENPAITLARPPGPNLYNPRRTNILAVEDTNGERFDYAQHNQNAAYFREPQTGQPIDSKVRYWGTNLRPAMTDLLASEIGDGQRRTTVDLKQVQPLHVQNMALYPDLYHMLLLQNNLIPVWQNIHSARRPNLPVLMGAMEQLMSGQSLSLS